MVPKQGVLALEPRDETEKSRSEMPPGQDRPSDMRVDVGMPSATRAHDRQAADVSPQANPAPPAFTLPKDAVLRAGTSSAGNDPPRGEPGRPDAPVVKDPASRPQNADRPVGRPTDAAARKLMLEDGMPERDAPPREEPDLGDLEL